MKRTLTTLLACAVMVAPAMATDYTRNNSTPTTEASFNSYGSVTLKSNNNTSTPSSRSVKGGAIYSTGSTNFTSNGDITLSSNKATQKTAVGGAIYSGGAIEFSSNTGDITFSSNTATGTFASASGFAYGGAICGDSTISFDGNSAGTIEFSGNTAQASTAAVAKGGAINATGVSFTNNSGISFSGNKANGGSPDSTASFGGAICASADTTFDSNGNITFSNNTVSSSTESHGGAIGVTASAFEETGSLKFSNNGVISFTGNTATGSSSDAIQGGAIFTTQDLTFSGNGDIRFIGNKASNSSSSALGGAIYTCDSLTIQGSALFQKNTEISNGSYRLRSIYRAQSFSGQQYLKLIASTDKSIEFRDSIYSFDATFYLNGDGTTATDGTIRFTGKYTEDDLKEMKGGTAGTDTEIANSRTSELYGNATLYGGKLIVEEKAVLSISRGTLTTNTGSSIEVSTGAQLNLAKANTTISALTLGGGTVTLGTTDDHAANLITTSLTVTADSTLNANLVMDEGTLTFSEGAVLTMGCSVTIGDDVTIVLADEVISAMKGGSITSYDLMDSVESATVGNVTVTSANSGTLDSEWSVKKSGDKLSVVKATPEPATATLSLLALAGLCARRRRK